MPQLAGRPKRRLQQPVGILSSCCSLSLFTLLQILLNSLASSLICSQARSFARSILLANPIGVIDSSPARNKPHPSRGPSKQPSGLLIGRAGDLRAPPSRTLWVAASGRLSWLLARMRVGGWRVAQANKRRPKEEANEEEEGVNLHLRKRRESEREKANELL